MQLLWKEFKKLQFNKRFQILEANVSNLTSMTERRNINTTQYLNELHQAQAEEFASPFNLN